MTDLPPYLAALNEEQRRAAMAADGPVLIVAGAGSGKTRLLIARIRRLIERGVEPGGILAVTFTRKAADEMRSRLRKEMGGAVDALTMGTFHAVGAMLLRHRPAVAGLAEGFGVADEAAARRTLKEVAAALVAAGEPGTEPVVRDDRLDEVLEAISAFKDLVLDPDEAARAVEASRASAGPGPGQASVVAATLYGRYQAALGEANLADFGDLLLWPVRAMERDDAIRAAWSGRWRHILVDEYQDTNRVQHRLLALLARDHANVFCVGDDDQAIYGFRRADVRYILDFEQDYPGAKVFRLETNYRSTPTILAAANAVIGVNLERRGKTLRTSCPEGEAGDPCPIRLVEAGCPEDEAAWVACEIAALPPGDDVYVLYRANWQSRAIEEGLIDNGIEYRIVGDVGFYKREEIQDALAYLAVAVDGCDRAPFERIVNVPARGIGPATRRAVIESACRGDLVATSAACAEADQLPGGPNARAGLRAFAEAVAAFRSGAADDAVRLERLLEGSGYLDHWRNGKDPRGAERLDNVRELLGTLSRLGSAMALFDRAGRAQRARDGAGGATLMTLHASKGLEAPAVFLVGWAEGVFPSKNTLAKAKYGASAIEEERRLAYVGITRAMKRLSISWFAADRSGPTGGPSRFAQEIPAELTIAVAAPPVPRPPSEKKLAFARDILGQLGLPVPDGIETDGTVAEAIIDAHFPALKDLRAARRSTRGGRGR